MEPPVTVAVTELAAQPDAVVLTEKLFVEVQVKQLVRKYKPAATTLKQSPPALAAPKMAELCPFVTAGEAPVIKFQ